MQLTFLNFENKHTRTRALRHAHTHTRMRAEDNLQYNISTELNILKCAHDFVKYMLCLAYTIILELKSNIFFRTNGHKEQFYFSKVCSD